MPTLNLIMIAKSERREFKVTNDQKESSDEEIDPNAQAKGGLKVPGAMLTTT